MSELAKITCACGFEVIGADEQLNNSAHAAHVCHLNDEAAHWYDAVFSFWGLGIVALIGLGATEIIKALTS